MTLYDYAMKILKLLIPEFKKEGMNDKDIEEGFEVGKRILDRIILNKEKREVLKKALDDSRKGKK